MAINADIQQQVYDLLSRASNISFVSADQEPGSAHGLTPGQQVSAEVLTTLPNNRTQVRVGSGRFNLELPMPVRPGQHLEMTFVSADPRTTFAISRQGGESPPVSLSDASRLLSLLVSSEQIIEPGTRSSLQSIGDILRRSPGEAGVLANLLDDVVTYREAPAGETGQPRASAAAADTPGGPAELRLAAFESNAARMLQNIAQNSRFVLLESANQPVTPLPFTPGEEVNATVAGTLPDGRAFLQMAGSTLELTLPREAQPGEILRLTYITSQPKPVFAMPRQQPDALPALLSEAGRWLSVLEHTAGGVSGQQMYVLERLNTVLDSLPPDSPAFTAIQDEPITYQPGMRGEASERSAEAQAALAASRQAPVTPGNGIVLNDDMARLLQAVINGNRLALLEALNQQAMPAGFVPGQQLRGEVLYSLGGGRFMVQVAGQTLEFSMPKGVKRGDRITLFFITDEPNSTFLMVRFGRPGDSRVSETGRWLSTLLGTGQEQVSAPAALNILRTLLSSPPSDAVQLSSTLQQGLRESGLFYESHLARWFGGEYPLEELLKEPQGKLSHRLMLPAGNAAGLPGGVSPADMSDTLADAMEAAFKGAGAPLPREAVADQRTLPVVSEQLASLQNSQLLFRGDLFPGQNLEWRVAEREANRNEAGERERSWETSVNIDLPELGAVEVKLKLEGGRISVDIRAEDTGTPPFLESGKDGLAEQLEAAGLTPAAIVIQHATQ